MALDRQSIERKDFPLARRGYDPAAVDAHLTALADQVAELERSAAQAQASAPSTLAASTSDQVHAIIAAAENSAAQIRAQAEAEAKDSAGTGPPRRPAISPNPAPGCWPRLEQTKRELEGADRLAAGRHRGHRCRRRRHRRGAPPARGGVGRADPARAGDGSRARADRAGRPARRAGRAGADRAGAREPPVEPRRPSPHRPASPRRPPPPSRVAAVPPAPDGDPDETEGARLVALNMALNGTPRERDRPISVRALPAVRRDGLLDEVYSSVES